MTTAGSSLDITLAKLEAQLQVWSIKIEDLLGDASDSARKQLAALTVELDAARAKLDEAKQAGRETWGELKQDLERAWQDLEDRVRKLRR